MSTMRNASIGGVWTHDDSDTNKWCTNTRVQISNVTITVKDRKIV